MAPRMSNCPHCGQLNSHQLTHCVDCRKELPWAQTVLDARAKQQAENEREARAGSILEDDFKWQPPPAQPEPPRPKYSSSPSQDPPTPKVINGTWLGLGIVGISMLFILGITLSDKFTSNTPTTTTISQSSPAFNVPSIVGRNITEVRAILGQPTESEDQSNLPPNLQTSYSSDLWVRGSSELYIEYDRVSGRVRDIFIPVPTTGSSTNMQPLLDSGGLVRDAPTYRIEPVDAAGSPGEYTGIKIVPR